jgi:charged multivesicular body protein 2A
LFKEQTFRHKNNKMDFFKNLFKRGPTPEEQMKEYKRNLDKTIRELERERTKLASQEKQLHSQMKKTAKQGDQNTLRIMAKDLVRTRRYQQSFFRMKMQIQAVSLRLTTMTSVNMMTKAMAGVTKAMRAMNGAMNLPQMQGIMAEFERQNEMMGMKEEMINEAIDDAMAGEDDETEMDTEVNKVMDEVMMEFKKQVEEGVGPVGLLPDAQLNAPVGQQSQSASAEDDSALESRLNALKTAMN